MLPPHARLTQSSGFRAVYGRGRSYATDLIVLYVLPRPGGDRVRFGFSAGKKLGGAVVRNRAKRLMREGARALLPRISGSYDFVVIARKPVTDAAYADVVKDLRKLLERAGVFTGAGEN
ncbi:MAG TPA: ribonuclease P protein component [Armatimonadota bacterium]|nr:ribonuclease P protein component [Armatimonadota bacterium]